MTTPITARSIERLRRDGPMLGEPNFLPLLDALNDSKPSVTVISFNADGEATYVTYPGGESDELPEHPA